MSLLVDAKEQCSTVHGHVVVAAEDCPFAGRDFAIFLIGDIWKNFEKKVLPEGVT